MTKEKETKPEGVKNKYIDNVEAERLGDWLENVNEIDYNLKCLKIQL